MIPGWWVALCLLASPEPPPLEQRPLVVVDHLSHVGLLLPSAQEVVSAVVLALSKRYGPGLVVTEDELQSLKMLRRMTSGMPAQPGTQEAQQGRMRVLEWAVKEAPYRVRVGFEHVGKTGQYRAWAECRERQNRTPLHRVEGMGKRYADAVEDLRPRLLTFCGILDGAMAERARAHHP